MRRRRNADAPDAVAADLTDPQTAADTLSTNPAAPTSESSPVAESPADPAALTASAVGDAATAKPARRRNPPRAKVAAESEPVAPVEAIVPPVVEATAEPAPEPPSVAPRPVRRRRTPAAEAAAAPDAVTPVLISEPAPETPQPDAEAAPVETPGAPKPARRRGPTRSAAATAAPEVAAEEIVPTTEAAAQAEPAPAAEEPVAESRRARGSRGRRRRQGAEPEAAAGETAEAASSAPDSDSATEPAVAGEEPRGRRSRGRRRRASGAAAEAEGVDAAEAAPEIAADDQAAEERRRVRGPRQRSARAETAPESAPQLSLVPLEPLPPPYQALPENVLARLPETRVVVLKNVPTLIVNGESRLPLWFFVNTEDALFGENEEARAVAQREIRLAYDAGIRLFSFMAHLPWRSRSGERRFGPLETALQFLAENAPEALLLPRLIFSPPASWERAHADQMTRYADGETGDVSIASRSFWESEADEALRAAVEHIAQGEHAGRILGFYLEHGEWLYEKGRGYDLSEANSAGFRSWLRTRYRNSVVALRASWYDGSVTFETAEIPPALPPAGLSGLLFFTDREQRYVDFHEYSSDVVAGVILRLGKAVKEASGGRSAVAVSYGYTLELARAYSGHLALGQVLASPNVDILTGPVSYSGRTPGGSAPLPAPIDSITLAGKLWVSEDDTKTFLAHIDTPDSYNTKIPSFEGTWAAHTRNFGAAVVRGVGHSWMDLWGTGWLDDRELWQRIGKLRSIGEIISNRRLNPNSAPAPEPDVAVIVDERSFFDLRADEPVLGHLVAQQRDALVRSGARVGFYLLSDLLKKNFPATPRLLIFLNAFRIPDTLRAAIRDRYQDGGRTLAWVYGPGCRETNLGELTDVIGMQLRLQPWSSKIGTQALPNVRSPLTDGLRGERIGEEVRINPSFYAADPKATALGEYMSNGNPSLAYRKHARWQSVFVGEMTLPIPLLRGLYRLAGVPVYTVDDDVATLGDSLICLHSAPGGGTTVYLPEEGALYDLLSDEVLASGGHGARLSMPPRGTRLLCWGTAAEISALSGDLRNAPLGLSANELPPLPPPFLFEAPSNGATSPQMADIRAEVSAEDDALMRAALAGDLIETEPEDDAIPVEPRPGASVAETADAAAAAADAQKKRRRRRRRGRGRGGADSAEGEGGTYDESGDAEETSEFDVAGDAPVEIAPQAVETEDSAAAQASADLAPARVRPTLEELLPLSEVTDGFDLPPIPEEFLPLDSATPAAVDTNNTESPQNGDRRRRRSRGDARRRAISAEAATADGEPVGEAASTESEAVPTES